MPADDGPDDWQRIDVDVDMARREVGEHGRPRPQGRHRRARASRSTPVDLPAGHGVATSRSASSDCRFDVDQIGVPVLVKVSYFPNWQAQRRRGAVPRRPRT